MELICVFVVAVLLNYLWELAQAPLYVGLASYNGAVFWHCFIASLGDGLMVLVIVGAGWIALKEQDWFAHPRLAGYLIMLTAGLLLALFVEWVGLHILERWQYTDRMPTVPGLDVGLVPIAQMLLLPPVVFRTVALWESRKRKGP